MSTSASGNPCCSFCKGRKGEGGRRVLVVGKRAVICDLCVAQAASPMATVAYCAACTAQNGKHAPDCRAEADGEDAS